LIGRTLSHFEITAKLGEGGMGEVYLAQDHRLERRVALKVLPSELSEDPERLKRLKREARSLAALDHPNIVPIYSMESAEGVHFLTMAYIEGEPLEQLIPAGGFSIRRLLDLAVPMADALRAAHREGIVHRDLKPANVMLDRDGRLRVLDFGLAKRELGPAGDLSQAETRGMTEQMTREGMILGTYPYMSPEQAEGRSVDARSDLFSFGIMLYEMACGARPFEGQTGIGLITAILRDDPQPLAAVKPELPARLGEILDRCLEKKPDDRYASARELRDELEALRRDVAAGTVTESRSQMKTAVQSDALPRAPSMPDASRWRGARPLVAAAIVAVLAIATWKFLPQGSGESISLAVLPFENVQQDEDVDYLCDGVAESLIHQMGALPEIAVSPLTAVLRLKGRDVGAQEAGRLLGVETVLAGTLELDGSRLQVSTRLLDVESGEELWSQSWDRDAADLISVQNEIAEAVLDQGLRVQLSSDEQRQLTRNPTAVGEAHDLYLQARYLQRLATEDDYLEARVLLERAIARDPEFALAYLWLAATHSMMVVDGLERPTDGWPRANRNVRRAIAIDPDLPSVPAFTHGQAFFFDWDWEGARRERELAMQSLVGGFDPDLLRTFALERWALGHPEEALALARRSRELDPLSVGLAMLEADYLVYAGQPEAALTLYERTIDAQPDNPEPYFGMADALAQQGRFDEAIDYRRRAHAVVGDGEMAMLFEQAVGEEGYREADLVGVRRQLDWLEARERWGYISPLELARAHAQLGDVEKAFERLDQAFVDRSPGLVFLNVDRAWDRIRSDPRFEDAVLKVGLPTPG
jgi:serine/threonine protein kinase/tetratricopeptide (TPR) repeat protein